MTVEQRLTAMELKYDALQVKYDALQVKYDALQFKYDALQIAYDDLERTSSARIAELEQQLLDSVRGNLLNLGRAVQVTLPNSQCSICLEEEQNSSSFQLAGCHHCFHEQCIVKWLSHEFPRNYHCPICRASARHTSLQSTTATPLVR